MPDFQDDEREAKGGIWTKIEEQLKDVWGSAGSTWGSASSSAGAAPAAEEQPAVAPAESGPTSKPELNAIIKKARARLKEKGGSDTELSISPVAGRKG